MIIFMRRDSEFRLEDFIDIGIRSSIRKVARPIQNYLDDQLSTS